MAQALAVRLTGVGELERDLAGAVSGDEAAARRYARRWHALVDELLREHPDAAAAAGPILDHVALTAPFDPSGPVHALVSAARGIIDDVHVRSHAGSALPLPDALDYERFARAVLTELSGAGTGLERLLAAWQLSVTEAAELFGVSRQAVQQWLDGGVPSSRQPKLLVILQIADLLERNLEPSRIPGAVRAPAGAYRGRSFVEVIAADRHREVLDRVAASFDWAATA
ncbi:MAG TPA: helix-turn-helix domain-containing protein [Actinomycetota bacterium]|jgi:hypothetical protein